MKTLQKSRLVWLISGVFLSTALFVVATQHMMGQSKAAKPRAAITAQGQRGHQLFLHSTKGQACATCHQIEGEGTAVGPDLTNIASVIGPHGLVGTIKMTMTAYVQEVKTSAATFPGIPKSKEGDVLQIWDLSVNPPELRTLKAAEVTSMKQNEKWKHPPTGAGYTDEELADIIAYLRWAAVGSTVEVKASDL